MTSNKALADRARELADTPDATYRRAALCAAVALGATATVEAARDLLRTDCLPSLMWQALGVVDRAQVEDIRSAAHRCAHYGAACTVAV
jgi:hypothetical protein